jgi:hypothetical protein
MVPLCATRPVAETPSTRTPFVSALRRITGPAVPPSQAIRDSGKRLKSSERHQLAKARHAAGACAQSRLSDTSLDSMSVKALIVRHRLNATLLSLTRTLLRARELTWEQTFSYACILLFRTQAIPKRNEPTAVPTGDARRGKNKWLAPKRSCDQKECWAAMVFAIHSQRRISIVLCALARHKRLLCALARHKRLLERDALRLRVLSVRWRLASLPALFHQLTVLVPHYAAVLLVTCPFGREPLVLSAPNMPSGNRPQLSSARCAF